MKASKRKILTIVAILLLFTLVLFITSCDLMGKEPESGGDGNNDTIQLYYNIEVTPVAGVEVTYRVAEPIGKESAEGVLVGSKVVLTVSYSEELIFEGWEVLAQGGKSVTVSNGTFVMPAANVTVTALVKRDPSSQSDLYRVTVEKVTGGSVTASPSRASVGDSITLTQTPDSGYEFVQYLVYDAERNVLRVENGVFTMPQSNVTVTGVFREVQEEGYRVTILEEEGVDVTYWLYEFEEEGAVEVIPGGARVVLSVRITDPDTTFVSWEVMQGNRSIGVLNNMFTMPQGSVTVKAIIEKESPVLICYENMDGAVNHPDNPTSVKKNEEIVELVAPQRDGYRFLGWQDEEGGLVTHIYPYLLNEEYHLYAIWVPITYTIAFSANGGSGLMEPMEAEYNQEIGLTACDFLRKGYSFLGWAISQAEADRGTIRYTDTQTVSNLADEQDYEVELYAVWEKQIYRILYIENGETEAFYDITSEGTIKAPVGRNDQAFTGWLITAGGEGGDWTLNDTVAVGTALAGHCGNVSLTASYEPFRYAEVYSYDETDHWRACTNAGYADLYTDKGAHSFEESTVPPTLQEQGYRLHQCRTCAYSYRDEYVDQLTGDLIYELTYEGTGYAVVGFKNAPTSITVPAAYNGLPVTRVAVQAFKNCLSLTSLEIPNSVTYIGMAALEGCSALTEVKLPFASSVSYDSGNINSVFGYIFGRNSYADSYGVTVYRGSGRMDLTGNNEDKFTFYLPNSLRTVTVERGEVASVAFANCTSLQTITLGDEVTSIGNNAFYRCTALQKLTIGSGVTSIGSTVLWGCGTLTELTIPFLISASEDYPSIKPFGNFFGINSFSGSVGTAQYYSPTDKVHFYIPSSLTTVTLLGGDLAVGCFENCANITSITLPEETTRIPSRAFFGCSNLTSDLIGEGIVSIGTQAFFGCTKYTRLTLPNSLIEIGKGAFSSMSGLTFIEIPFVGASRTAEGAEGVFGYIFGDAAYPGGGTTVQYYDLSHSVTYYIPTALTEVVLTGDRIPYGAFCACVNLQSFTFSKSVTSIAPSAFLIDSWKDSLTAVYYDGTLSDWAAIEFAANSSSPMFLADTLYCEDEAGTTIHNGKKYSIPHEITLDGKSIGVAQFAGFTQLTSVEIKNGVTEIKENAFWNCANLTSLIVPDSVTAIAGSSLTGCTGLQEIVIGNGVDSLPYGLLSYCGDMRKVTLPFVGTRRDAGESAQGNAVFGAIFGITTSGSNVELFSQNFSDTRSVDVRVPNTLTEIKITGGKVAYGAFSGMKHIWKIELTDGVTFIDKNAFKGCGFLMEIKMPYLLDEPGSAATHTFGSLFGDSSYEHAVACGDDYTTYYFPQWLYKITITSGRISTYAFNFCQTLAEVIVEDGVESIGYGAFKGCSSLATITLPFIGTSRDHSVRTADSVFGAIFSCRASFGGSVKVEQKFDSGSTEVRDYYLPSSLKHVILNGTEVPAYAFYGCASLETITLADTITRIGECAFVGCAITEIDLPDALTSIDTWAFGNCAGLTAIELPEGVTSVGYAAFQGCSSLKEMTLPAGITVIPGSLFQGDGSLQAVTILGSLTKIEDWAFRDTSQLTTIVYAGSEEEWNGIEKGTWWRSSAGGFTVVFNGGAE